MKPATKDFISLLLSVGSFVLMIWGAQSPSPLVPYGAAPPVWAVLIYLVTPLLLLVWAWIIGRWARIIVVPVILIELYACLLWWDDRGREVTEAIKQFLQ